MKARKRGGRGTNLIGEGGDESLKLCNVTGIESEKEILDRLVLGSRQRIEDGVHQLQGRSSQYQIFETLIDPESTTHQLSKVVDFAEKGGDGQVVCPLVTLLR